MIRNSNDMSEANPNLMPPTPGSDVNAVVPSSLDSFVGQRAVVDAVQVALRACRNTGSPFPSVLFTGAAGLGKSQLVAIIANEMGVELKETLAQTLESTADLSALLLEARAGEIVFLDEADALEEAHQVLLYRSLAEKRLFLPRGRSTSAARSLPLEDFTLVLATNHESRLTPPLVSRFKMICRFEFYSEAEMLELLRTRADVLGWPYDAGVLEAIARRGRGTPRTGLRIMESVHRVAQSEAAAVMTPQHVRRAGEIDGIDERGLDRTERAYLAVLHAAQGAVRLNVLADRLGLPARTIASCIEPYLVRMSLISRSDEGRSLTAEGIECVRHFTAIQN